MEILGALLSTYLFSRLCAWSLRPDTRRAAIAAAIATVAVMLRGIYIHLTTQQGSPEGALAHALMLYEPCVGLWFVVDLWRIARAQRLKLEAKERAIESLEGQIKEDTRQWSQALKQAENKLAPTSGAAASEGVSCPSCGAAVLPDARFCDGCGGRLRNVCAKCLAPNRGEARFCKSCGGPLAGG